MQFNMNRRNKVPRYKVSRLGDKEEYPFSLQFYLTPPIENISLIEFESFAVDRLKLLKVVENLGVSMIKGTALYNQKLEAELKTLQFPYHALLENDYDRRRKDHISHFILRLAYCQTEELRRWFIQQELDLFRYRFTQLSEELTKRFLAYVNLAYDSVLETEKETIGGDLPLLITSISTFHIQVPFSDSVDLVRVKRVYFYGGYAYVPQQDFLVILLNNYRTRLSKALAITARSLPIIQTDERLQPLLSHLSHAYVGPDYSIEKNIGKISLEQIDAVMKSFPPCMRQLHKALRENHHLRHGGRMQYGLFLKGIGLTLEQALQFWESGNSSKFDKGYAYNIRHSYGKEGKRTDYTPFSCMKIIMSNPPGQGDYHGCPFRHSDPELLKQKLQSYKIPPTGISQILDLVKGMHYQVACQKYFELTHDVSDIGFSLNHPNQYFVESQQLLGGVKEMKKEQRQPENSQPKYSNQKSVTTNSTLSSSNAPEEMELEGLEDYFAED
uniref:DNA primase large subunit n=1 Tax=Anolis carolinensis TaxID=28377 RepID=A0A803TC73_ANOCA